MRTQHAARTIFCREGWYYLAVLLVFFFGAMVREVNLMLLLAALLVGPLLLSWRVAVVSMRKIEVLRKMPRAIGADDPWVVCIDVMNRRTRGATWSIVVEQTVRRIENGHGSDSTPRRVGKAWRPAVYFPFVAAGTTSSKSFQGRIPQRGRYQVGPLTVSTRFPFGLFRREIEAGETETLTVYPHIGRLLPGWVTRQHDAMESAQRRQMRHSRVSGDLYGVRGWSSGDSLRWIHWRSSARHGNLVVRQFEQPRNRDAAVLLDLWQPGRASMRERENVELAVSLAATLVHEIYRRGGCGLVVGTANAKPVLDSGPVSAPLVERIMEHLALLEAADEDHLPELLRQAMREVEAGSEIVVISTRPVELNDRRRFACLHDDPALRAWVKNVRVLDTSSKAIEEIYQP